MPDLSSFTISHRLYHSRRAPTAPVSAVGAFIYTGQLYLPFTASAHLPEGDPGPCPDDKSTGGLPPSNGQPPCHGEKYLWQHYIFVTRTDVRIRGLQMAAYMEIFFPPRTERPECVGADRAEPSVSDSPLVRK